MPLFSQIPEWPVILVPDSPGHNVDLNRDLPLTHPYSH
jgi:hypothetical protein